MTAPVHAFVDIETTGLKKRENIILEIGIVLTDISLNKIDQFQQTVTDDVAIAHLDWLDNMAAQEPNFRGQEPWSGAKFVHEMHQRNGLATEIRAENAAGNKRTLAEVSHQATDWLKSHNVGQGGRSLPMVGNSIMFDRGYIEEQMPVLNGAFHYRNVDISSMKALVSIYRGDLVRLRADQLRPAGMHRSISDIDDSIEELKFYLEALFKKDL